MSTTLVTGASGNLGAAVCTLLLEKKAPVLGLTHSEASARALEERLASPLFRAIAADLADEAAVEAAFAAAGDLRAVAHTAGTWSGGPVESTTLAAFEALVATNLRTTFLVGRAAMRRLSPRGGAIVTVGAFTAAAGVKLAGSSVYAATKAAVITFTRALAAEGARHGVRANCVAPGTMRTKANQAAMPDADPSRWVALEDVAGEIVHLCSEASAGVTGAVVPLPER